MRNKHEHWDAEDDDVVQRLRDEKPQISRIELDGIKTRVMMRAGRSKSPSGAPRSRLLVAIVTVGLMAAGTAGTLAASGSSTSSGTGAAQSQYRPGHCRQKPDHRGEECRCPSNSVRTGPNQCTCPAGFAFAPGTNDCRCPDGRRPVDGTKCVRFDSGPATPTTRPTSRPPTSRGRRSRTLARPASSRARLVRKQVSRAKK
jgi:hypothetical protein